MIFSSFDEIVERLTKLKNWDFFQFFDQRMGLMPQQWKNTNIFAYFATLRPSFIILFSKKIISLDENSWKNNEK